MAVEAEEVEEVGIDWNYLFRRFLPRWRLPRPPWRRCFPVREQELLPVALEASPRS